MNRPRSGTAGRLDPPGNVRSERPSAGTRAQASATAWPVGPPERRPGAGGRAPGLSYVGREASDRDGRHQRENSQNTPVVRDEGGQARCGPRHEVRRRAAVLRQEPVAGQLPGRRRRRGRLRPTGCVNFSQGSSASRVPAWSLVSVLVRKVARIVGMQRARAGCRRCSGAPRGSRWCFRWPRPPSRRRERRTCSVLPLKICGRLRGRDGREEPVRERERHQRPVDRRVVDGAVEVDGRAVVAGVVRAAGREDADQRLDDLAVVARRRRGPCCRGRRRRCVPPLPAAITSWGWAPG